MLVGVVGGRDLEDIVDFEVEVDDVGVVLGVEGAAEEGPAFIDFNEVEGEVEREALLLGNAGLRLHEVAVFLVELADGAVDAELELADGVGLAGDLFGDEGDDEERFFDFLGGVVALEILGDRLGCLEPAKPFENNGKDGDLELVHHQALWLSGARLPSSPS